MGRRFFLLALIFLPLMAWGQVDSVTIIHPDDFPAMLSLDSSEFQFFSLKDTFKRKADIYTVRKFMLPQWFVTWLPFDIDPATDTTAISTTYRGYFVKDQDGQVFLVDALGFTKMVYDPAQSQDISWDGATYQLIISGDYQNDPDTVTLSGLYSIDSTTVANIGDGEGFFYQLDGNEVQLKTLKVVGGTVASTDSTVTITVTGAGGSYGIYGGDGSIPIGGTDVDLGGETFTMAGDETAALIRLYSTGNDNPDPGLQMGEVRIQDERVQNKILDDDKLLASEVLQDSVVMVYRDSGSSWDRVLVVDSIGVKITTSYSSPGKSSALFDIDGTGATVDTNKILRIQGIVENDTAGFQLVMDSEGYIFYTPVGGGTIRLNDLADVDTTGIVTNDLLKWNGSDWVPISAAEVVDASGYWVASGTDTIYSEKGYVVVNGTSPQDDTSPRAFSVLGGIQIGTPGSYGTAADAFSFTDATGTGRTFATHQAANTMKLGGGYFNTVYIQTAGGETMNWNSDQLTVFEPLGSAPVGEAGGLYFHTGNGFRGHTGSQYYYLPWAESATWAADQVPYSSGQALKTSTGFTFDGTDLKLDPGDLELETNAGVKRDGLTTVSMIFGSSDDKIQFNLHNGANEGYAVFQESGGTDRARLGLHKVTNGIGTGYGVASQNDFTSFAGNPAYFTSGYSSGTSSSAAVYVWPGPGINDGDAGDLYLRGGRMNAETNGDISGLTGEVYIESYYDHNTQDSITTTRRHMAFSGRYGNVTTQLLNLYSHTTLSSVLVMDNDTIKTATPADIVGEGGAPTGSGAANQVAYWDGTSTLTGDANFTYDGNDMTVASGDIHTDVDFEGERLGLYDDASAANGVSVWLQERPNASGHSAIAYHDLSVSGESSFAFVLAPYNETAGDKAATLSFWSRDVEQSPGGFYSNGLKSDTDGTLSMFTTASGSNTANDIFFKPAGVESFRLATTGAAFYTGLASDPLGAAGGFYYNSTDNEFKWHNGTAWAALGENIYNTDGTLTGVRTVTMGSDYVYFTGSHISYGIRVVNSSGTSGFFQSTGTGYGVRGISNSSYGGYFQSTTGAGVIGTTAGNNDYGVIANVSGSYSGSAYDCLVVSANTSGTAGVGFGGSIRFNIENDGGGTGLAGRISMLTTDATSTDAEYKMQFMVRDSTISVTALELLHTGGVVLNEFDTWANFQDDTISRVAVIDVNGQVKWRSASSMTGTSYTFDSGLTESGGNVDLGGDLTSHAIINGTASGYAAFFQGEHATTAPLQASNTSTTANAIQASGAAAGSTAVIYGNVTGTGIGVHGQSSAAGGGIGVQGTTFSSTVGTGVKGTGQFGVNGTSGSGSGYGGTFSNTASSGGAIQASPGADGLSLRNTTTNSSTGTVDPMFETVIFHSGGLPTDGIGVSWDFYTDRDAAGFLTDQTGRIIHVVTDVSEGVMDSDFEFYLSDGGTVERKLRIAATGQVTADDYANGALNNSDSTLFVMGTDKTGDIHTINVGDLTADTQLTQEQVEDYVGGMVTGNTENGIDVTYEDSDGTLDFDVEGVAFHADSVQTANDTLDCQNRYQKIFRRDMTSRTSVTFVIQNPHTEAAVGGPAYEIDGEAGVYSIHLQNISGTDAVTWPTSFKDVITGTALGTINYTDEDVFITAYYDGTDYWVRQ